MPSIVEFEELYDNCNSVWTTLNGVPGRLFTSLVNGKTLFLPAAGAWLDTDINNRNTGGYYWSSTYNTESNAHDLYFKDTTVNVQSTHGRRCGFCVRAVMDP